MTTILWLPLMAAFVLAAVPATTQSKPGPRRIWTPDADHWRVEKWAGNDTAGGYLQGPATEAGVVDADRPAGLAFDRAGNAVMTTHSCLVIRTPDGVVRYLAGVPGVTGHRDGPAHRALFCQPQAIVSDGENFFILDRGNFCIRRLFRMGEPWQVVTVAGVPGKSGKQDGPAREALFGDPCNLALDENGFLYTFDQNFIRRIGDGKVETLNPKGGVGYQDGPVETARFNLIMGAGCGADLKGRLYVADRWNVCLRVLDLKTLQVSTVCGVPKQHYGQRDGPADDCSFHDSPGHVVYDPVRDCLYSNGVDDQSIRRFDFKERMLRSLAGKGGIGIGACGPAKESGFCWCATMAVDAHGDLYASDGGYPVVRRLHYAGPDKPTPVAVPSIPLRNRGFIASPAVVAAPGSQTATQAARDGGLVAGPERVLHPADGAYQRLPACAFGSDGYLLVWQDGWSGVGGDANILGLRLSADGEPLSLNPITVCAAKDQQEEPAVACSGGTFLVVWQDFRGGRGAEVYGARVDAAGQVLDPQGILIAGGGRSCARPRVAARPGGFYVVWQEVGETGAYGISGARVGLDGKVLDPAGLPLSTQKYAERAANPDVAAAGDRLLVMWEDMGGRRGVTGALLDAATGKSLGYVPVHTFWGGANRPRVATNGRDFLMTCSRTPYPDYWGWGGPGGVHGARILADGAAPDLKTVQPYKYQRWPNVLDVSGKDIPGQWPHRYSAVAWDGKQYVAAWIRAHVANRVMLTNYDIIGTRIRFGGNGDWEKPEGSGLPLAASAASEGAPVLVAGPPGRLLLVYETFPADGRILVACRTLSTK
jgi:hypothetical protein